MIAYSVARSVVSDVMLGKSASIRISLAGKVSVDPDFTRDTKASPGKTAPGSPRDDSGVRRGHRAGAHAPSEARRPSPGPSGHPLPGGRGDAILTQRPVAWSGAATRGTDSKRASMSAISW